jgi:hypothetical protein
MKLTFALKEWKLDYTKYRKKLKKKTKNKEERASVKEG